MDKHRLRTSLPDCPARQAAKPLFQGLQESLRGSLPCCKEPTGTGFSRVTQHRGLGNCRVECVCAVPAQLAMPHWAQDPQRDVSRLRAWAERFTLLCPPSTLQQWWALGAFLYASLQESSKLRYLRQAVHVLGTARQGKSRAHSAGQTARQGKQHGVLGMPTSASFLACPTPGSQQGRAGEAGCW